MGIVFGMKIIYLSAFGLCGFYSPCLHCLNEHLHLWDTEPLVLIAGFYCLPTATRSLMPVRYSLAILGIEYFLWFRPLLMSVRYALHWIVFNSSVERWIILTLISNEYRGIIDFNGFLPVGPSVTLLPDEHCWLDGQCYFSLLLLYDGRRWFFSSSTIINFC